MRDSRHLSWESFEQLILAGHPAVEVVVGQPKVEIFTDAGGARIGVRTPSTDTDTPPSPLVEIDIRQRRMADDRFVEIATSNRNLYRDFYAFACAVADRLQVDALPVTAAVDSALQAWAALLQRLAVLDDERQAGLIGELWLLRRLADSSDWTTAVEAWKGSDAEEHDFSWAGTDMEVKTTLSEKRVHIIGSLTQLVPTGSIPLFVLSIQLTGAGAGTGQTITDAVSGALEQIAMESPAVAGRLRVRLHDAGWREEHASHYRRRFALRSPPTLVPVDDTCPAITPATLSALGPDRLARVGQVAYRVDLTGLGHEDGSAQFLAVLPARGDSP